MLKKFYKITVVFSLLLVMFMGIPAYANENKSVVPVIYNISEDSRYNLNIKVSGDGTVYDGDQSIKNGNVIYQLKVSEEKSFKIIPDKESKLKSISWKNKNTDLSEYYELEDIRNGKSLTLKGVATDSELIIEFGNRDTIIENSEEDTSDPDIKDDGEKSPQTGDKGIAGWIILLILSLTLLLTPKFIDSKKSKIKK